MPWLLGLIHCLLLIIVLVLPILPTANAFTSSTTSKNKNVNKNVNNINNNNNRILTTLRSTSSTTTEEDATQQKQRLEEISRNFNAAFEACRKDLTKTCNVKVGLSKNKDGNGDPIDTNMRLGWIATNDIKKGDILMNMPYDEMWELSPKIARKTVFKGVLDDAFEGWTGDTGLLALQLLNEIARYSATAGAGIAQPARHAPIQAFMGEWIKSLPTPTEMKKESLHPLFWSEEDQEVLQSSSNTKVYRVLDDIEEDANWLIANVFDKDRNTFPETVMLAGEDVPCFSVEGYKWAMALTRSRAFFVDGTSRLLPFMDMCNHDDNAMELRGGYMGTFGTTKGAEILSAKKYKAGDEVFLSHGPKSAADYLLEHGFASQDCWKTAVSEVTVEVDADDRLYEDKMDILEFETYDQAPMDPSQSFDVISAPGRDGEPDPAFMQFVRLMKLNNMDAFLLESIFRKEVWGFMAFPVSQSNELAVVDCIVEVCESSLEDLKQCPEGGLEVCTKLRESESKALKRTLEYMLREKEALDLKEYYQERRLKDLGLDSDWTPEDDIANPDLSFGQKRSPGGADFDW